MEHILWMLVEIFKICLNILEDAQIIPYQRNMRLVGWTRWMFGHMNNHGWALSTASIVKSPPLPPLASFLLYWKCSMENFVEGLEIHHLIQELS
jgi:hypothetical protein